jgi:hypothetical protein
MCQQRQYGVVGGRVGRLAQGLRERQQKWNEKEENDPRTWGFLKKKSLYMKRAIDLGL